MPWYLPRAPRSDGCSGERRVAEERWMLACQELMSMFEHGRLCLPRCWHALGQW